MKNKLFIKFNELNISLLMDLLNNEFPDAKCSLNFTTPFELLVAVMLSAQCTDERVNKTTPSIFSVCNTPQDFANIDLSVLEELIHPCGFYKVKAKNLKSCGKKIMDDFNGKVPQTMEELTSLPGVGRKSANVIMLNAFHKPVGIAVDTHAKRISYRLGLSSETDPLKVEQDLLKILPKQYIPNINHLFVYHGRKFCTARKPHCEVCPLSSICPQNIL